jgi:hypothetical protein
MRPERRQDQRGDTPLRIRLPTGGTLVAPADPMQDLPSDCSRVFGLLPLVATYLASTQCSMKVLELVGPLTDLVAVLGRTPELAAGAAKFLRVAQTLAPCELATTAASAVPFVRDVLCVILRAMNCILGQLKNLIAVMTSLASQLEAAKAAGNANLVHALETAQKNAQVRAASVLISMEAVQSVLDLASPWLAISGIERVQLPSAPANADLDTLTQFTAALTNSAASLQIAVDALGGCSG